VGRAHRAPEASRGCAWSLRGALLFALTKVKGGGAPEGHDSHAMARVGLAGRDAVIGVVLAADTLLALASVAPLLTPEGAAKQARRTNGALLTDTKPIAYYVPHSVRHIISNANFYDHI
jgi:hypothetical protein